MTRITCSSENGSDETALPHDSFGVTPDEQLRRHTPTHVKTLTMQDQLLLVSNPPQGDFDAKQAAPSFGLAAAEVRMKANYHVPEIWVADRDQQRIESTAGDLRNAGLNVVLVAGERLLLPLGMRVGSFAFDEHGVTATVDGSDVEVSYDTPIVAVCCKPKSLAPEGVSGGGRSAVSMTSRTSSTRDSLLGGARRSTASSENGAPQHPAFVDLYVPTDGQIVRLTFQQGTVDFAGLGSPAPLNPLQGLTMLSEALETRFVNGHVDRRLVNMIPRRRTVVQAGIHIDYSVSRKGYSFASEGLSKLLGGIAPGLDELGQMELASRLAYLTIRHGQALRSHAT